MKTILKLFTVFALAASALGVAGLPAQAAAHTTGASPREARDDLHYTMAQAEPLTLDLQVDRGFVDRHGNPIIRGTLTCSHLALVDMDLNIALSGSDTIGVGHTSFSCEGKTRWEIVGATILGRFVAGEASVFLELLVIDTINNTTQHPVLFTIVQLKGKKK